MEEPQKLRDGISTLEKSVLTGTQILSEVNNGVLENAALKNLGYDAKERNRAIVFNFISTQFLVNSDHK